MNKSEKNEHKRWPISFLIKFVFFLLLSWIICPLALVGIIAFPSLMSAIIKQYSEMTAFLSIFGFVLLCNFPYPSYLKWQKTICWIIVLLDTFAIMGLIELGKSV